MLPRACPRAVAWQERLDSLTSHHRALWVNQPGADPHSLSPILLLLLLTLTKSTLAWQDSLLSLSWLPWSTALEDTMAWGWTLGGMFGRADREAGVELKDKEKGC